MGKIENPNNLTAEGFFKGEQIITPEKVTSDDFQANLRDQVLQTYLNYDSNSNMEESTLETLTPEQIAQEQKILQPVHKPLPFWKRKPALITGGVLIGLAVIALAIFSINYFSNNKIASAKKISGEVAYIEGNVYYQSDKTTGWEAATLNTVFTEGDSITISGEGRVIVNLDDGSALRLNSDSTITFTSADPAHTVITNNKGEVYSRIMKADRTFDIVADGVTYRSLGTAYRTYAVGSSDSSGSAATTVIKGVEVYESNVKVMGTTNADLIVKEGEQYFVNNSKDSSLENNVTELSLATLQEDEFIMWNKSQDEENGSYSKAMGILCNIATPALTLSTPSDGTVTTSTTIIVSGTTDTDTTIMINDKKADNNHGSFSYTLDLTAGINTIKIVVTDADGNKAVKTITVTCNAEGATNTPTPTTGSSNGSIVLSKGTVDGNGITLNWTVANLDTSNGFKIVKGTSANPVYPGNDYQYVTGSSTRSYTWKITDGATYHFRICQYNGNGACLAYSNDITVTAASNNVTNIVVSANGADKVSWVTTGNSSYGFKVVWSKTSGPEYPNRSTDRYQYFGSPSAKTSDTLTAFDGSGTYFVRVCSYNGNNACIKYSNQITLTLSAGTTDNTD